MKLDELTPHAVDRLREIIVASTDEKMVMAAVGKVLDFTMSKPAQGIDLSVREEVKKLTDQELLERARKVLDKHPKGEREKDAKAELH